MLARARSLLTRLVSEDDAARLARVAYHVLRAAKKFAQALASTAWVLGTTTLVMVMPLVFEIDREQALGYSAAIPA